MPENKTKILDIGSANYLQTIQPDHRRVEAQILDDVFQDVTDWRPKIWGTGEGTAMIGYGCYTYTYASGHSGTFFATGFAIRKTRISIYIMPGYQDFQSILNRIGKHKHGKSCLYVNTLKDINLDVLRNLIRAGLDDMATRYTVNPT
jgi:hypothetical protein